MSEQRNAVAATGPEPDIDDSVGEDVHDARILIVDDSPSTTQFLRAVLRKAG